MGKYQWEDGMGEISGFGGGYEEACQKMLFAGLAWLDEHPTAEPKFRSAPGVYGLLDTENDDAREMSKAIVSAVEEDCTGAMHQAAVSHCLFVRRKGWDEYVAQMKSREK